MKNSFEEQFIAEFCGKIKTEGCSKNTIAEQVFDAGYRLPSHIPTADADGWIDWAGGECPVDSCAAVDVIFRSKKTAAAYQADRWRWDHNGTDSDIIAYRLSQPQTADKIVGPGGGYIWNPDANSRANDDRLEADLNDCIGQAPGAPQWDGQGLPPVGAEVEWYENRRWYDGVITAVGERMFIIKDIHGEEAAYNHGITKIRPANFERDEIAAIIEKALDKHAGFVDSITLAAAELISAGYRKQ